MAINKLWAMLLPDHRRSVLLLSVLLSAGMVLETAGIGIFIPTLALMTQADFISKHPLVGSLLPRTLSREELVILAMLALVAVNVLKGAYQAFLAWFQAKLVYGFQADLSQRLFVGYLRQPYTFHLQRNSAELITVVQQVGEVGSIIQQGLILVAESMVVAGVSGLLLAIEPLGTLLIVGLLGGAAWLFNRLSRRRLLEWGEARQYHETRRVQHLQQGLGSAKDVKLLGREQEFVDQYAFHSDGSAHFSKRQAVIGTLPRLWLELLAITALAALVVVMVIQGKPLDALVPTIGLFGAAAFRLLPSANRIVNTVQNVRYYLPVINSVHEHLGMLQEPTAAETSAAIPFEDAISVDQVTFRYSDSGGDVLEDVSLRIAKNSVVGLIGSSGSGKSTLIDLILGLLAPDKGAINVDGVDIRSNMRGWQNKIGYVPQTIYLTDDTLRRNIAFGIPAAEIDDQALQRATDAAQLRGLIEQLPEGLDTFVGERGIRLSGGQRQRIGIARALYHDPQVLVLDEATSALDGATEQDVMAAIRNLRGRKTIIIVAHRLSTVQECDRLFRMEHGRIIAEGAVQTVLDVPAARNQ